MMIRQPAGAAGAPWHSAEIATRWRPLRGGIIETELKKGSALTTPSPRLQESLGLGTYFCSLMYFGG